MRDSSGPETDSLGNVRLQQVETLLELLVSSAIRQKDHIRRRFGERAAHFDETLQFALRLGYARDEGETISLGGKLNDVAMGGNGLREELICRLSARSSPFRKMLSGYLAQFKVLEGRVSYRPIAQRSSRERRLRNLLMDLDVIVYNDSSGEYVLNTDFISLYLQVARDTVAVAPETVSSRHDASTELGSAAEQAILSYERSRLREPYSRCIKHVAETDASAGYDIESVTVLAGSTLPRLIEVKAVPASNLRFFWTTNEVAAARRFGAWYYLYLLPLRGEWQFDIDRLVIIEDPYEVVIRGDSGWCVEADILRCEMASRSSRPIDEPGATA